MSFKKLFRKATNKAREESFVFGVVGVKNPSGPATIQVVGEPNQIWVTRADKTPIQAHNEAGVPHTEDLEVKMRVEFGEHVIVGPSSRNTLAIPIPTPPSGVLPHPLEEHSDVDTTAAATGDVLTYDGADWIDETPIVTSAGAGDAGKLIRLDAAGHVDATMINDGDIDHTAITNIGTNSHATIDTHIAATTAHGATGAVMGTTNAQLTQNKTLDSTNISTLTAKTTPVDADSAVIVDSAAANVFKRTLLSDFKAFLKTYFDTLYGLLATANIWTQNQSIASTQTTGHSLNVTRNLASASTNAPVVSLVQDHAGDDQGVLRVQQDGGSWIIKGVDGTTDVFLVDDGGNVTLTPIATTGNALRVVRDLAAASTAAPVVDIVQDNAGDDQHALRVQQDGTGDIVQAFDAALRVFAIHDGGILEAGGSATSTQGDIYLDPANKLTYIGRLSPTSGDNSGLVLQDRLGNAYFKFDPAVASQIELAVATGASVIIGTGTAAAKLHVLQPTLGSVVQRLQSTATNDDPTEDVIQGRVTTTDATVTTVATITIPASTTVFITATVVARRTGGVAGTAEDGAAFIDMAAVTNIAGAATLIGSVFDIFDRSNQASWDCTIDVTGATARVRVTGALNNNVVWHAHVRTYAVSS